MKTAIAIHGSQLTEGIRLVYGDAIEKKDGNIKEKGVDALLVADLIYHAAVRNYEYALVVSTDTDFVQALHRVEDFGCRSGVLAFCNSVPERLKNACDETFELSEKEIIESNYGIKRTS